MSGYAYWSISNANLSRIALDANNGWYFSVFYHGSLVPGSTLNYAHFIDVFVKLKRDAAKHFAIP